MARDLNREELLAEARNRQARFEEAKNVGFNLMNSTFQSFQTFNTPNNNGLPSNSGQYGQSQTQGSGYNPFNPAPGGFQNHPYQQQGGSYQSAPHNQYPTGSGNSFNPQAYPQYPQFPQFPGQPHPFQSQGQGFPGQNVPGNNQKKGY